MSNDPIVQILLEAAQRGRELRQKRWQRLDEVVLDQDADPDDLEILEESERGQL